jgi:predicted Zn-dependent peptidase
MTDEQALALGRVERRLITLLAAIANLESLMSQELDDLKREVQESRSVTEGAAALISGLADQIRDAKDDPAALEELAQQLDAQTQQLASAVTANTPNPQPGA